MRAYFWNLLIAVDQLVNTLLGGFPDETLSSRMGKAVTEGRCLLCRLACALLDRLDPGHCARSIEADEGRGMPSA